MKYFVWLLSAVNLYFGVNCLLNALGILQTSKYSHGTDVVAAILFLSMGAAGFYFTIFRHHDKLALLICLGPWVLGLLFVFISMITGYYK